MASKEAIQAFSDAAYEGNIAAMEAAVASGVPLSSLDFDGFTPLHRAAVRGNIEAVKFLLSKGADVNLLDAYGDTPMHYACFCGHKELVPVLIAAGGDPYKPSKDGKSPAESAADEGHGSLVDAIQKLVPPPPGVVIKVAAPPPPPPAGGPGAAPAAPPAAPAAGAAATPAAPKAPSGAPPPPPPSGPVPGLDFTKGVIMEGELRKKRANKVMKWRKKYYVLSRTYGALFFWTGTRTKVEGVIKKVRFETFFAVRHFPEKQGGKRFELRVVTGRSMQLLASSTAEARKWVDTLHSVLGPSMAALRIQAAWRGYRARKQLKKMQAARVQAVTRLALATPAAGAGAAPAAAAATAAPGAPAPAGATPGAPAGPGARRAVVASTAITGARELVPTLASGGATKVHGAIKSTAKGPGATVTMSAQGIRIEGELKKKSSTVVGSFLGGAAYRARYFVLHTGDAQLYYFDSKAQRVLGVHPRAIPFLTFYNVTHILDKKGAKTRAFVLRVVSGRSFVFEARSPDEASNWVAHLLAVLPRENAAAIKLQAAWRRFKWRKLYLDLLAKHKSVIQSLCVKYGKEEAAARKAAVKIQAHLRMRVARRKYLQGKAARAAAEKAALAAAAPAPAPAAAPGGAKPAWLAFKHVEGAAPAGGPAAAVPAPAPASGSTASRLAKLREIKALREKAAAASAAAGGAAGAADGAAAGWGKFTDPNSGHPYWFNSVTGETTWTEPAALAGAGEGGLPPHWSAVTDPTTGRTYYFNKETGESSWEMPAGAGGAAAAATSSAPKQRWIKRTDPESGAPFYANVESGETSWEPPAGLADGTAKLVSGEWFSKTDPSTGAKYYVSVTTGETSWDRPTSGYESDSDAAPAASADPWVAVTDPSSGQTYYFNKESGERSWTKPGTPAAAVVQDISGGSVAGVVQLATGAGTAAAATSGASGLRRSISMRMSVGAAAAVSSPAVDADGGAQCVDTAGDVWTSLVDPKTNRVYWWNGRTGESSWTQPEGAKMVGGGVAAAGASDAAAYGDPNETLTFTCFAGDMVPGTSLPLTASPPALFSTVHDGILLCRLVAAVAPDALDTRVIDMSPLTPGLDAAAVAAAGRDNCQLAISAAQVAGCVFTRDVTPDTLAAGVPQAVLDFVWQCFKIHIVSSVSVRGGISGISRLAAEGETLDDLLTLPSETILLRWVNFQLEAAAAAAGVPHSPVSRFGAPLADGVALSALVRAVCPPAATSAVPASDDAAREVGPTAAVTAVLGAAFAAGVPQWFSVEGLTAGNIRLQLAFAAYLFKVAPNMGAGAAGRAGAGAAAAGAGAGASSRRGAALLAGGASSLGAAGRRPVSTARVSDQEAAALERQLASQLAKEADGDNAAYSREARTVAQWLNALDIEGVYVRGQSLSADVRDGTTLLKVLDVVEPGIVAWNRVNMRPANRYKQIENCNYIINLGKAMDFHLTNVSGLDIVDGNPKLVLAFMGQLMRFHTLKMLSSIAFDGFAADESEILAWANERVAASAAAAGLNPDALRARSLGDSSLASGVFLLHLLASVRPGCVQWEMVAQGSSRDDHESNARYVLSLARRLGANVFATPEDIVDVKQRALLLFIASVMVADSKAKRGESGDAGAGVAPAAAAAAGASPAGGRRSIARVAAMQAGDDSDDDAVGINDDSDSD